MSKNTNNSSKTVDNTTNMVYTYSAMKMKQILEIRDKVLEVVKGHLNGFFLAGGTALSLFYFHHRESYDLDFFTKEFSKKRIEEIISKISDYTRTKVDLMAEQSSRNKAKMLIYNLPVNKEYSLKIDFIEDIYRILRPQIIINDIPVLSKEDIYLRKIFAACGSYQTIDDSGKNIFLGGRQDAKDFFDLYHLSRTFMRLSNFAIKYCTSAEKESIIIWYKSYDRFSIKSGLVDIITDKKIDYTEMDRHFKLEVENLIQKDIE